MKISANGLKQIGKREGTVLHGYKDSKGLLTVGVGHLVKAGEPYTLGGKITQAESDKLLESDLAQVEKAINSLVKVPLTQNQYDALCSFVFNIGIGGFSKSSALKSLNNKDYQGASANLMKWVKPPELRGRRESERKQFDTPDASVPTQPIQPADENNSQPVTQNAENNTGDSQSIPPSDKPVVVTAQKQSPWSLFLSGITILGGWYQVAKSDYSEILDKVTGVIDWHFVANAAVGAALVGLGLWMYDRSKKRADDRTHALIATAADTSKNTVELK